MSSCSHSATHFQEPGLTISDLTISDSAQGPELAISDSAQDPELATAGSASLESSCNDSSSTYAPILVDTVLSFIKAYRLKADKDSLRMVVNERFSSKEVVKATYGSFVEVFLRPMVCTFMFGVILTEGAN